MSHKQSHTYHSHPILRPMQLTRVMAPEPEDSPKKLARLIDGAVGGLFAFLDLYIIPPTPKCADYVDLTKAFEPHAREEQNNAPTMYQIYAAKLARHVKRVEHTLRCFLFLLATKLIADPESRARLTAQQRPHRAPPTRRPYDPDILVQLTKPEPKSSFTSLPYAARTAHRGHSRRLRYTPLDWKEVEIAHLMARMAELPKVLKSAERRAETLARRLLSGDIALTEDEIKGPAIQTLGGLAPYERPQHRPAHCPVFLRHLSHWLPPPDLYADCHDDDRDTLNKLHRLAFEAAPVWDFS